MHNTSALALAHLNGAKAILRLVTAVFTQLSKCLLGKSFIALANIPVKLDTIAISTITHQKVIIPYRHSPTLKPGPVRVSADCPFSPISVVLLPCSQVSWHCPFRQILLQIRGAMTTLKRSRVIDVRSAHRAHL